MWGGKRVSVVLMTYAERDSIRRVIEGFFDTGVVDEVLVVNNNAEPGTEEEIRNTPARQVHESRQGYGHATRRGLLEASGDLVVLAEPDGTFLPEDVRKLLEVLHALVEQGNTVVVIEHNLEVIKTADFVIDLGPEGGDAGGRMVAAGTPEQVARTPGSYTGAYLARVLAPRVHEPDTRADVLARAFGATAWLQGLSRASDSLAVLAARDVRRRARAIVGSRK